MVVFKSAIVIAPVSAVTLIAAAPPVVMSLSCVTTSPKISIWPLVELTTALMSTVPAAAFRLIVPDPFAVTTLSMVRLPATTSTLMFPFPPSVRTPVPLIVNPFVSWI